MVYHNLVLSGGGVKGICHIGALMRLVQLGMIDMNEIRAVAGSSVGAILGMFLALRYSLDQIKELVFQMDISKLVRPDITLLMTDFGMDDGAIINSFLEKVLETTTGISEITFEQLYSSTQIEYTVVGSCVDTKKAVYYNHINTPNFPVTLAIRISYSIPGFFTPVVIDNKKYVDGSVLDNFPMKVFEDRLDDTIGILLCGSCNTESIYPEDFVLAIINLLIHTYFQKSEKYPRHTIYVHNIPEELSVFGFRIDDISKEKLIQCGVDATDAFCKKIN